MKKLFLFTIILSLFAFICSAELDWDYKNVKDMDGAVGFLNSVSEDTALYTDICEPIGFSTDYYVLYPVLMDSTIMTEKDLIWTYEGVMNMAMAKAFLKKLPMPHSFDAKIVRGTGFYNYFVVYRR